VKTSIKGIGGGGNKRTKEGLQEKSQKFRNYIGHSGMEREKDPKKLWKGKIKNLIIWEQKWAL
jgi:hypothetical protein